MRRFLNDITIVGAMLVSRAGPLLHYSIPNLLKWCDWILIMLDNEDEATTKIVSGYKKQYDERIRIAHSGFSRATEKQEEVGRLAEKEKGGLLRRFRSQQGEIRETVFRYLRGCSEKGERIDILIWPDSDEVFSDSFPELLKRFWATSDKRAITMKPVAVFDSMKIIKAHSMAAHVRVLRYATDFVATPRRALCNYNPITKRDRMADRFTLIHLHSLLPEMRKWRSEHWKTTKLTENLLWKTEKDVRHMTPSEIEKVLKDEESFATVGEYLKITNQEI